MTCNPTRFLTERDENIRRPCCRAVAAAAAAHHNHFTIQIPHTTVLHPPQLCTNTYLPVSVCYDAEVITNGCANNRCIGYQVDEEGVGQASAHLDRNFARET